MGSKHDVLPETEDFYGLAGLRKSDNVSPSIHHQLSRDKSALEQHLQSHSTHLHGEYKDVFSQMKQRKIKTGMDVTNRVTCPFGEEFILQSHDLILITLISGCCFLCLFFSLLISATY